MSIEAQLRWQSAGVQHVDALLVVESALFADGRWLRAAQPVRSGAVAETELDAAAWIQPVGQTPLEVAAQHFRLPTEPIAGRFYPRMAFKNLALNPGDKRPTRVLAADAERLLVEVNHPLAGGGEAVTNVRLVFLLSPQQAAHGVRLVELFEGPGMQVPASNPAVTYFQPAGLRCQEAQVTHEGASEGATKISPDADFYAQPRFVHHLDAVCRAEITALYQRMFQQALPQGQRVLDLMSSWCSHLPPLALNVAGLGMNAAELAANPQLSERVVQDLNGQATLPWPAAEFDAVVCTASIEYLRNPAAVVAEVRRVLKPGGVFIVTFSDRWFPTKAVKVWSELHPFERLGWVLAVLQGAGFTDLHSETRRGLQRPQEDKYIEQRLYSDPLFAAWGRA